MWTIVHLGEDETFLCPSPAPLLPFLLGPKIWNVNGKVDAACGLRRVLLNCSLMLLIRCRPGCFHLHIAPLWKHGINHRILLKPRNETRQIRWLADSTRQIKPLSRKLFALSLMKWEELLRVCLSEQLCRVVSVFPCWTSSKDSSEHSTGSVFFFFYPLVSCWCGGFDWTSDVRGSEKQRLWLFAVKLLKACWENH